MGGLPNASAFFFYSLAAICQHTMRIRLVLFNCGEIAGADEMELWWQLVYFLFHLPSAEIRLCLADLERSVLVNLCVVCNRCGGKRATPQHTCKKFVLTNNWRSVGNIFFRRKTNANTQVPPPTGWSERFIDDCSNVGCSILGRLRDTKDIILEFERWGDIWNTGEPSLSERFLLGTWSLKCLLQLSSLFIICDVKICHFLWISHLTTNFQILTSELMLLSCHLEFAYLFS